MGKDKMTADEMVQAAIEQLKKGILADYDLKIKKAFELGAEIGAAKGAEIGARAAAEAIEREREKCRSEVYNRQLRNTKLLLQHYRSLNSHYANAVWEEEQSEDVINDEFYAYMAMMNAKGYSDTVFVDSIKKSSEKTKIIMRHVNKMLGEYEKFCNRSKRPDDKRHWRVIKALYLVDVRVRADDIAEREHIDKRTVYKDVDAAVEDLTMLLFGVEGIEKLHE